MAVNTMRQPTSRILAISLVVAMLLITVYVCNDVHEHAASLSAVASIFSTPPDWIAAPLWEPPYREFEILSLPSNQSWPSESKVHDLTIVRPAWGIFAAIVGVFLYFWANSGYGGWIPHPLDLPLF